MNLCDSLATLARRLCTEFVDPLTIEPILASWLIPRQENYWKKVTKQDIIEASSSLQVCTGSKSGSAAAIHAIHDIFEEDNTDAVLLIDASSAFNSLHRATSLHNVRMLCPTIATCAINTYREPARLFIIGGKELRSQEGTTQGDPLAMCLYAVSLQPLIARLNASTFVKQCWFADDCWFLGGTEEMVRCTKRIGTELRIFSQCEKVLAYCEARERRGSERSFWSNIN